MTETARARSEAGFTLIELMIAAMLTVLVMGVAFSTFENAAQLNETVVQMADQSQNLRAGTNLLIRDLLQAGRNLPTGGMAIPSGDGAEDIYRPGPDGGVYTFDNTDQTTLTSIVTGGGLGPAVSGEATDMITILMDDPFLSALTVQPSTATGDVPKLSANGASLDMGDTEDWHEGDADNGIAAVAAGDLFYFLAPTGTAIQTVTRVEETVIYFDADDPFNFNQRAAEAGSITQILGTAMSVRRVLMYTYWVEEDDEVPRLMRALNFNTATALAGSVEDLTIRYDLVDGTVNPTDVENLPYELDDVTYTATQIRKVNLEVGVRSENINARTRDYIRNRVQTVVSIRNLAFVDRYQ